MKEIYEFNPATPKKKSYLFSLSEGTNEDIKVLAKALHITRSEVIEKAIVFVVEQLKGEQVDDSKN